MLKGFYEIKARRVCISYDVCPGAYTRHASVAIELIC